MNPSCSTSNSIKTTIKNLYPYHYNHHHYNLYFEFYNISYQHNDNVE